MIPYDLCYIGGHEVYVQPHRRGSDGEVKRRASEPFLDLKVNLTTTQSIPQKPLKSILKKSKFGMPEKEKESKEMTSLVQSKRKSTHSQVRIL